MADLSNAIDVAVRAHFGQLDQTGEPYILHCMRVMAQVRNTQARIVAVLHDILEDTSVTVEELRAAGFDDVVIEAVESLTRRDDEPYMKFILRAHANPVARVVKMADLQDNFNLPRTLLRSDRLPKDLYRLARYMIAYRFLDGTLSEDEFRKLTEGVERLLQP